MELTRISQRNLGRDNRMVGNEPQRINQCCRSGFIESDPDPAFQVIQDFDDQELEKNTAEKNLSFL